MQKGSTVYVVAPAEAKTRVDERRAWSGGWRAER